MIPDRNASEQMSASFRLGRILGIPVEVNITWILIFLLITYLVGEMFGQSQPILDPGAVVEHIPAHCAAVLHVGIGARVDP